MTRFLGHQVAHDDTVKPQGGEDGEEADKGVGIID
jgi:hypothetical protein